METHMAPQHGKVLGLVLGGYSVLRPYRYSFVEVYPIPITIWATPDGSIRLSCRFQIIIFGIMLC